MVALASGPAPFMDSDDIRRLAFFALPLQVLSLSAPTPLFLPFSLCLFLYVSQFLLDFYLIPAFVLTLGSGFIYIMGDKAADYLGYILKLVIKEIFPCQLHHKKFGGRYLCL